MATTDPEEESVEYVELLDVPVFAENEQEVISLESAEEMPQVLTIPDDSSQVQEVEYIQAEELNETHTIIVHEGKQYVIPTEQLHQAGNTFVLEDDEDLEPVENTESLENEENMYYTEENTNLTGQFAVLKDGKLHIQESGYDIQEKFKVLEESLNEYEESPEEEETETLSQITGKNLITGQTISLSGFLDKLKRKGIEDINTNNSKSKNVCKINNSPPSGNDSSDYISVAPVNRRVVVGKTTDGKKLVGRILQIQKKITPGSTPQKPNYERLEHNLCPPLESLSTAVSNTTPLDDNLSRTLSGLMDLESVAKYLTDRRLIVKHVQRRSLGGKALASSRKVAFYTGRMVAEGSNNWTFIQEEDTEISIDDNEMITLYLTVTQDELGKKRTKVSIPQLAKHSILKKSKYEEINNIKEPISSNNNICNICGKKFQSFASLKRHASVHDPNLRPLQCLTCFARFSDESSLKKHLLLHSGLRPHVCGVCNKTFAHRGDLNFHSRTHDPVKRFKCELCSKQFHRFSNLVRHSDVHRQGPRGGAARRPPYVCDTCGSQYNFISSLTRHIVSHHMTMDEAL